MESRSGRETDTRDVPQIREIKATDAAATDVGATDTSVTDRAVRDTARLAEEKAKVEAVYAERLAKLASDNLDPAKLAEETAKLSADLAEEQAKIAAEGVKIQAEATEQAAKDAQDAAKDAAKLAEDQAKDAQDAAEDAADQASRDDATRGSSETIRDLGDTEGAEHDDKGFAVRRGELVGMDIAPATLATAQAEGFRVISQYHLEMMGRDVVRLAVPDGVTAPAGRERIRQIDPSAVIDLVHYYGLDLAQGGRQAAAPSRDWHKNKGGSKLSVGVIDTAVSAHSGLAGAQIIRWSAGSQPSAPVEHGTAVASIIAAQGDATIYSANIFRGTAERPFTSADVVAEALDWMLGQSVGTINMSLAGPRNAILDRLIRDAIAKGRNVVAAAGNGGPSAPPAYPAAVAGVVAVTAVDKDLHIYRYANRGRYITVASDGVEVLAADARGRFARFTGTSFATPRIAAWIAACRARGASSSECSAGLRRAARDLGTAGPDDTYGYGYVR